jgi:murein DD-endopeptidase MepM/ murein hydrolase activator NlpD
MSGMGKDVRNERGGVILLTLWTLTLLFGSVAGYVIYLKLSGDPRYIVASHFIERDSPTISIVQAPQGLGPDADSLVVLVEDDGAGVDELLVKASQGSDERIITKKFFDRPVQKDSVRIPLDAKELGLSEGPVKIKFTVFDRAFWSNSGKTSVELSVDFHKPQIQVLSSQHNAVIGGSEVVFYKLYDEDIVDTGVRVGKTIFHGVPAREIDRDFESTPAVYAAFFSIPVDFDDKKDLVRVIAIDRAGNNTEASFYYRARHWKGSTRLRDITTEGLDAVRRTLLKDFFPAYPDVAKKFGGSLRTSEEILSAQESFERVTDNEIRTLLSKSSPYRIWEGAFRRPNAVSKTEFGDRRQYMYGSTPLRVTHSLGVEFRNAIGTGVGALGKGKILAVGNIGVFGQSVLIDHGSGLSTLYATLKGITVKPGDEVSEDQIIGRVANSTLFGEGTSFIQFRLWGTPVRPNEWWDTRWVEEHIEDKFAEIKQNLAIASQDDVPTEETSNEESGE